MNDKDRLEVARLYQNLNQSVVNAFENRNLAIKSFSRDGAQGVEFQVYRGQVQLLDLWGFNFSTSAEYYIQLFDTASTPPDGSTPLWITKAVADTTGAIPTWFFDRDIKPRFFQNGIYVCASTTSRTKTISAANDVDFHANLLADAPQAVQ